MVAKNDVTGDNIQSKVNSDLYKDNYEKIFGSSKPDSVSEVKAEEDSQKPEPPTKFWAY